MSVFDYNNNEVKIFGTTKLECIELKLRKAKLAQFVVVDNKCEPILGLTTCESLRLIKRINVRVVSSVAIKEMFINKSEDGFEGLRYFLERSLSS